MAKHTLTLAFLELDGDDISSYLRNIQVSYSADVVDASAMGDTTRTNVTGLLGWTITATCAHDSAAALESILWPLVGQSFPIEARKNSGAVSADNPQYQGTGILTAFSPINGAVGALHETPITIVAGSALTRVTA